VVARDRRAGPKYDESRRRRRPLWWLLAPLLLLVLVGGAVMSRGMFDGSPAAAPPAGSPTPLLGGVPGGSTPTAADVSGTATTIPEGVATFPPALPPTGEPTTIRPIAVLPGPIVNFRIGLIDPTTTRLDWGGIPNETGFDIQRRQEGGEWRNIAEPEANARTYTDPGLTPNSTYSYRIRAVGRGGAGPWSNAEISTTPPSDPTPAPEPTSAPEATNTAVPTPANTPVPEPTNTPIPTSTPTPEPTNTPTPEPTNTPVPEPTNTPVPEPTATPASSVQVTTTRLEDSDFNGGYTSLDGFYKGRTARWVYAQSTEYFSMNIDFTLAGQPVGDRNGNAAITIHGMDSEDRVKTPISIVINGQSAYEGPNPLPNDTTNPQGEWSFRALAFPFDYLKRGSNRIVITNLASDGRVGAPPFFLFDYAVIYVVQARTAPSSDTTSSGAAGRSGEDDNASSGRGGEVLILNDPNAAEGDDGGDDD